MPNNNIVGQYVDARINKVVFDTLFLTDNKENAIRVRNFEIDNGSLYCDLRKNFSFGQQINIFIRRRSSADDIKPIYFGSIIPKDRNPWLQKFFPLRIGDVVTGRIVVVLDKIALVSIENSPCIQGLISINDISSSSQSQMSDFLCLGDRIKGKVEGIDKNNYEVKISIKTYNTSYAAVEIRRIDQARKGVSVGEAARITTHASQDIRTSHAASALSALIVDDNRDVLNSFSDCLVSLGLRVERCISYDEAYSKNHNAPEPFDFLFVDYDLSFGYNGLDLIRHIHDASKMSHKGTYLFSGATDACFDTDKLSEIGITDILFKPVRSNTLSDIIRGSYVPRNLTLTSARDSSIDIQHTVFNARESNISSWVMDETKERISYIEDVRRGLMYDAIGVFYRKEMTQDISLAFGDRLNEKQISERMHHLALSPLTEVFNHQEELCAGKDESSRFHEVIPGVSSFMCFPVTVGSKVEYSLAYFKIGVGEFSDQDRFIGRLFAQKLAVLLDRLAFKKLFEGELTFAIFGRLLSGLNHELRTRIQPVETSIHSLRKDVDFLFENPSPASNMQRFASIYGNLSNLSRYTENLEEVIELFLKPIIKSSTYNTDLLTTVNDSVRIMKPSARTKEVRVVVYSANNVPHKVNFPSLVLYHILTNLILNAIQQKNKPLGIVIVQLRYEPEHELPIYIDVIDNSRGIHASHYDEIFKALFTTKPDGVGIGLYIAQSLANSNGASLALHESFVLGGSTFRLTLPHQIGEIS